MKNKLFIASLIAVVTIPSIFCMTPTANGVQSGELTYTVSEGPFKDVTSDHPSFEIINEMHRRGYISGYPDGTFKPDETISRKHVSALLSRVTKLEPVRAAKEFKDVSPKNPNYTGIQAVQRAGIMGGDEHGDFKPEAALTRAQIAKVLDLAFHLEGNTTTDFKDIKPIHWANEHIMTVFANGVMTGTNGYFNPNDKVTRGDYAVFLYRVLNKGNMEQLPSTESTVAKPIPGQLMYYSEADLRIMEESVAISMSVMARQKITQNKSDVVTNDELYFTDISVTGELLEQNLLYLKRFVEKGTEMDVILEKWLAGDFSEIISDYVLLLSIISPESVGENTATYLKVRTKEAEQYYLESLFGKKALNR